MTIKASLQEFEGYDLDESRRIAATADGRKEFVKSSDPNPIFRKRELVSDAIVLSGQTIVLFDSSDGLLGPPRNSAPLLGDLPFVGRRVRDARDRTGRTNLVIFVTPTLIDAAGNRVSP
jgi:type II secretory pathway component GspD/PulD (secretin)